MKDAEPRKRLEAHRRGIATRRATNDQELRRRLERAGRNEDWVAALADWFDGHDLAFGHGTDNSTDEAYWLLRHLHEWRDELRDAPPDRTLLDPLVELAVRRVRERKPLAYLLGEAWFAGLRFRVDERVLVPRSPIAELIERRLAPWCALEPGDRVLDIGTGSGCLGIAVAVHCPGTPVDATDVSADALAVAADNVALHGLEDRVRLYRADLFPDTDARYRAIISNPPYVPAAEIESLPPEYAHEPELALRGDAAGLGPTLRLLDRAADYLLPDGVAIVEVGDSAEALMQARPRLPFVWVELGRGGHGVFVLEAGDLHRSGHSAGGGAGRNRT